MSDTTQDGLRVALSKAHKIKAILNDLIDQLVSTLDEFHEHHDDMCHNGRENPWPREEEDKSVVADLSGGLHPIDTIGKDIKLVQRKSDGEIVMIVAEPGALPEWMPDWAEPVRWR